MGFFAKAEAVKKENDEIRAIVRAIEDDPQLELFPMLKLSARGKTHAENALAFHALNPHVYRNLRKLALIAVRAGRTKIGIGYLWERLRWEYFVNTDHKESEFALNNNYRATYARLLADGEPELENVFEFREMKSAAGGRRIIVSVK